MIKPSANRKCRKSTEVTMWLCPRGAFFGFSFSGLAPQAISTHFSALNEGARLPGDGKFACRSTAHWNGGGPDAA